MGYTKEIISEEEADWRKGKTKAEIHRHLSKPKNHNCDITYGLWPKRVERLERILKLIKRNKEYTTKELNLLLPEISNKILRNDLNLLRSQGKISERRSPNLVYWKAEEKS